MKVRKATIADSPAIARIQVDGYRTAYAAYFPQPYLDRFTYEEETQDWQELLSSETGDVLLVAENGAGKVAGYALGRRNTDENQALRRYAGCLACASGRAEARYGPCALGRRSQDTA